MCGLLVFVVQFVLGIFGALMSAISPLTAFGGSRIRQFAFVFGLVATLIAMCPEAKAGNRFRSRQVFQFGAPIPVAVGVPVPVQGFAPGFAPGFAVGFTPHGVPVQGFGFAPHGVGGVGFVGAGGHCR